MIALFVIVVVVYEAIHYIVYEIHLRTRLSQEFAFDKKVFDIFDECRMC